MIKVEFIVEYEGNVIWFENVDKCSIFLFFVNMFDEIFLFDNSLCMDFVFLLISMMIEDSVVIEDFILSLEDLFSIDYL